MIFERKKKHCQKNIQLNQKIFDTHFSSRIGSKFIF